jgi:hypothetical protein
VLAVTEHGVNARGAPIAKELFITRMEGNPTVNVLAALTDSGLMRYNAIDLTHYFTLPPLLLIPTSSERVVMTV